MQNAKWEFPSLVSDSHLCHIIVYLIRSCIHIPFLFEVFHISVIFIYHTMYYTGVPDVVFEFIFCYELVSCFVIIGKLRHWKHGGLEVSAHNKVWHVWVFVYSQLPQQHSCLTSSVSEIWSEMEWNFNFLQIITIFTRYVWKLSKSWISTIHSQGNIKQRYLETGVFSNYHTEIRQMVGFLNVTYSR